MSTPQKQGILRPEQHITRPRWAQGNITAQFHHWKPFITRPWFQYYCKRCVRHSLPQKKCSPSHLTLQATCLECTPSTLSPPSPSHYSMQDVRSPLNVGKPLKSSYRIWLTQALSPQSLSQWNGCHLLHAPKSQMVPPYLSRS